MIILLQATEAFDLQSHFLALHFNQQLIVKFTITVISIMKVAKMYWIKFMLKSTTEKWVIKL